MLQLASKIQHPFGKEQARFSNLSVALQVLRNISEQPSFAGLGQVIQKAIKEIRMCTLCRREDLPSEIRDEIFEGDFSLEGDSTDAVPFFEVVLKLHKHFGTVMSEKRKKESKHQAQVKVLRMEIEQRDFVIHKLQSELSDEVPSPDR